MLSVAHPPVTAPVVPMLARLARELPVGGFLYEPKWDGFRCIAFVSDGEVDLRSRHGRPLARYFPELVGPLAALGGAVIDGEIVAMGADGSFDFAALLKRLHPAASRVERLSLEEPASFICFDLLAAEDTDLRGEPFRVRRARLEALLAGARPPLHLTPSTESAEEARRWLERFAGGGVDGVVAKHEELRYQPGRRAMVKVKRQRTADCVVAGYRRYAEDPAVASLLLGLYDEAGALRHVGVCAAFPEAERLRMSHELAPLVMPLVGHPWERGFGLGRSPVGRLPGSAGRWLPAEMDLDWLPLRPTLVCEVAFDQLDDGRFRHAAQFVRWRPDREAASCTLEQLETTTLPAGEILGRT